MGLRQNYWQNNPHRSNSNSHLHELYSGNITLAYSSSLSSFTSRPPTSARTQTLDSNQPCFHRNHCQGNADSASLQCRKNPKPMTRGLSVQPVKGRATTKTLWGEEMCVWLRERAGGGVIRHTRCVSVCWSREAAISSWWLKFSLH